MHEERNRSNDRVEQVIPRVELAKTAVSLPKGHLPLGGKVRIFQKFCVFLAAYPTDDIARKRREGVIKADDRPGSFERLKTVKKFANSLNQQRFKTSHA